MAIRIIQDKTTKKKKSVKRTASKKSKSSYTTRHTDLAIPYRTINVMRGGTRKKKSSLGKLFRMVFMLIFIVCLSFSGVFAYNHLMSYLCTLERFFIDTIEITGCNNVAESEIKELIPFQLGDSSFSVRLGQVEKDLKEFKTELKNISMYRTNWGKKIVVSLTERLPEVFINVDGKKFGLDFDNKPFNLRGNMSFMKIPTLVFSNEDERKDLLGFYHKIKSKLGDYVSEITEIKYGEVDDIVLTLNRKTDIYWGQPKDKNINDKISKLLQVLNFLYSNNTKEVESIDLSFIDMNKDKVLVKYSAVNEDSNA